MADWIYWRRQRMTDRDESGAGRPEQQGPYAGVGPKGYQRGDERIHEDVCDRLTQHGQLDASGIEVSVKNGEVWLHGQVDNRGAKRLAENIADSVPGVVDVHNRLQVLGLKDRRQWAVASAEAREGQQGIDWSARLHPGMPVVGTDGEEVGRVKEVGRDDFLVDRRMAQDIRIRFGMVDNVKDNTVMLLVKSSQAGAKELRTEGNLQSPYDEKELDEHSGNRP